jgi:hypothetical protein
METLEKKYGIVTISLLTIVAILGIAQAGKPANTEISFEIVLIVLITFLLFALAFVGIVCYYLHWRRKQ